MDIRLGLTRNGLVEVIRRRGDAFLARPLNRVKPRWFKGREVRVLRNPERGISLRMIKRVEFDQDCGCTAVVEFLTSGKIESFNVYGDLDLYLDSGVRRGLRLSEHHRRQHLRSEGFVRGKGLIRKVKIKDEGKKIRQFERGGYEPIV